MNRAPTHRPGFTLIEGLLASAILSLATLAITAPFLAGAHNDRAAARQVVATTLAQDLLEAILARPFADPDTGALTPGPEADERGDVARFDNIDDFHGYEESAGHVVPFAGGAADPEAATFARQASVGYVVLPGQNPADPPSVCRVTVRVRDASGPLAELTRLVAAQP